MGFYLRLLKPCLVKILLLEESNLLTTLENTPLAIWVGESLWAYPSLLACHIVGLAIVVGLLTTRDLKLLGFFPGVDYQAFSDLMPVVVAAFGLNAVSGFLLFSSQASYLATSMPFLAKLICITVGLVCAINQQMLEKGRLSVVLKLLHPAASLWPQHAYPFCMDRRHYRWPPDRLSFNLMLSSLANLPTQSVNLWIQDTYWLWPVMEIIHFLGLCCLTAGR